jgi:hypothetical protein
LPVKQRLECFHSTWKRSSRLLKKAYRERKSSLSVEDLRSSGVIFAQFPAAAKPLMRPWADFGQTHPVASRRGSRIKL